MENVLIKLKRLLNSIDDDELEDIELWVDNEKTVEAIVLDEDSVVLLTNLKEVKINGKEW